MQMKDQAVDEIEQTRAQERARVAGEQKVAPQPEEELAVEMFELVEGQAVRASSGLEVRMTSAAPNWTFVFDHHGRQTTVSTSSKPLYLEGVTFGHLYVITRFQDAVQITLRSDTPEAPLAPEAAFQIARRERTSRLGCDGEREETTVQDNGTALLRVLDDSGAEACHIVVGLYTHAVVEE